MASGISLNHELPIYDFSDMPTSTFLCQRRSLSFLSVILSYEFRYKLCVRHFCMTNHMKKDKTSSNIWLQRQRRDIFVKQAGKENYRCRSAFKLLQINERFKILKPGDIVIDCGAAPGSWCQVAVQSVNAAGEDSSKSTGLVIGVDLQDMAPVEGAYLLPATDFTLDSGQAKIKSILDNRQADVILSDMAPRATGMKSHNHEVIVGLCFSVLRFSLGVLKEGGTVLCKLWMGGDQPKLERAMKSIFDNVRVVKPDASRDDSAEIFLLGRGFKQVSKRTTQ